MKEKLDYTLTKKRWALYAIDAVEKKIGATDLDLFIGLFLKQTKRRKTRLGYPRTDFTIERDNGFAGNHGWFLADNTDHVGFAFNKAGAFLGVCNWKE